MQMKIADFDASGEWAIARGHYVDTKKAKKEQGDYVAVWRKQVRLSIHSSESGRRIRMLP